MVETHVDDRTAGLVGNRLVLGGTVLYLSEWVAIFAVPPPGPLPPGSTDGDIVSAYAENVGNAELSAAWFAVCLVGRVLVMAGLALALSERVRDRPLLDLAIAAMAISVALEVASYAVAAAAAELAGSGADDGLVLGLDRTAYWVNISGYGSVGVSVLAAGFAVLRSGLFRPWLGWLATASGAVLVVGSLVTGATVGKDDAATAAEVVTSVGVLGMWVWMIATGVVLFRRVGRRAGP